jgi:alpha-L-fucosidase
MSRSKTSRRDWMMGTGAVLAAATLPMSPALGFEQSSAPAQVATASSAGDADRQRRMKWWHEARFGMFIHWGLYSVIGRHEWVMENEGIPVSEYAPLAKQFKPKPFPAREWARIARETGMRYMVMTTKHHEGFLPLRHENRRLLLPQTRARPRSGS